MEWDDKLPPVWMTILVLCLTLPVFIFLVLISCWRITVPIIAASIILWWLLK